MRPGATACALGPLVAALACAGSGASSGEPGRTLASGDLTGWGGAAPAPIARDATPAEPIELAGGERFRSFVASTIYRAPSAWTGPPGEGPQGTPDRPHCSVYALRFSDGRLEEARTSGPCASGAAANDAPLAVGRPGEPQAAAGDRTRVEPTIPMPSQTDFLPVDPDRQQHLRAVLSGAGTGGDAAKRPEREASAGARTTVRLTTDRGTVEHAVGAVRWPDPGAEQAEPPRGRPPAGLVELWEAVLYPERYLPTPAPGSTTAAAEARDPG